MLLNRKLIIAVLTLGLMLSFSSAAIGYDDTKLKPLNPITSLSKNPTIDAPALQTIRNISDLQKSAPFEPAGIFDNIIPDRLPCELLSYSGSAAWYFACPDPYGDTKFATRYTATAAGTLMTAYVAVARRDGTAGLTISVYSDLGGYPDQVIATWDIAHADLPAPGYYGYRGVVIDAGNAGGATYPDDFIFAAGEEFHLVGEVTGGGTVDVESLNFVGDNATEADVRSSNYWGVWAFMLDDWGANYTFLGRAEMCYDEGPLEGDCNWYSFDCGAAWYWKLPDWAFEGNGETHYGVRFSAAAPETLKYVDIAFYGAQDSNGDGTGVYPTARVDICPPHPVNPGPDINNPDHTILVPPGDQAWWTSIDMVDGEGVVLIYDADFYVVVSVEGHVGMQEIWMLSDDGSCPAGRSGLFADVLPGVWLSYTAGYNWLLEVETCRDKYSACFWNWGAYGSYSYFWRIPGFFDTGDQIYVTGVAVSFDPAFAGCDLGEIDIWFYGGAQAEDAEVAIYDDSGPTGLPGNRGQYFPITGGSWPSGNFPNIASVFFDTKIWIVLESFAAGTDDIQLITDDGTFPPGRSAIIANGDWAYWTDIFTAGYNWVMDVYQCCYPFIVRTCAPDGDWPTMGKNYRRAQSTLNEMGDIQCNLTKSWTYVNSAGGGVTFAQPIIANEHVYAYMFNCLVAVDINTGIELWRRDMNYSEIGGSSRATPTYHDGALYCGGGDLGYFSKFNAATGATMWSYLMLGHAQYAPHVIMDVEGTEVVFVADGYGNIYGLQTSDGDNYYYPGSVPADNTPAFSPSGQIHKGLTTDGTYLYAGCDEYLMNPNVYRLAVAASGVTEDWNLVDDGPGWLLDVIDDGWTHEETTMEGIYDAILYSDEGADGQWLYFVGRYIPQNSSPVHNGGILYKVSADGTTLGWASECNGGGNSAGGGILDDKAQVIYGGWSWWIEGGEYYGPMAYAKSTGLPQWGPRAYNPNWGIQEIPDPWGHVSQPGVLTCETFDDAAENDHLIFGNEFGYWNFADATIGEVVWSRRSSIRNTYVTGPTVDGAGHLILGEGLKLHCLANDVPRQRLHIADMHPEALVPFGLTSYEEVVFEGVIVNSGCAPLEIFHVELLEEDNGTFPSRVSTVNSDRAENISTLVKENTGLKGRMATMLDDRAAAVGYSTITKVPAAYALPEYIISLLEPADETIIAAGGSADIRIAIDGTKIPRGASQFYAEIDSDDPDLFLDSAYMDVPGRATDYAKPTVLLTIVGGCLYDYTELAFGENDGSFNNMSVWNSTLIQSSNRSEGEGGFVIDDNTAYLYGCDGLFYSDDMHRVVMHAFDGGGNPTWESILPDPLPTCDFGRAENVVLAQMSNDGYDYDNVLGTMLNYAYVDSVEDHWLYEIDDEVDPPETLGVEWAWDIESQTGLNKPYSGELTQGFAFKALVTEYAVTDVVGPRYAFDDFWNFTISRHAVFSRYGNAIPGLFVGMIADWDVDDYGENLTGYSEEYSVGWIYDPTTMPFPDYGGGIVKVPFGPDITSLINTVDATTAWYGGEEPGFDSIYVWMSRPSTQFMNYMPYAAGTDRRMWNSIVELNLPAWTPTRDDDDPPDEAIETYGYAFFGKFTDHNAAALDNYTDMATLVNKFIGWGRGDVNNDGLINLVDIVYLHCFVHKQGPGPIPFMHMGDVNNDEAVNNADITYMINWYFNGGPDPVGDWALPQFIPAP